MQGLLERGFGTVADLTSVLTGYQNMHPKDD